MSLEPWQIALIALVVILLFGAGRIPRLMGDTAKGITALKKNLRDNRSCSAGKRSVAFEKIDAAPVSGENSEIAKSKT